MHADMQGRHRKMSQKTNQYIVKLNDDEDAMKAALRKGSDCSSSALQTPNQKAR